MTADEWTLRLATYFKAERIDFTIRDIQIKGFLENKPELELIVTSSCLEFLGMVFISRFNWFQLEADKFKGEYVQFILESLGSQIKRTIQEERRKWKNQK